MVWRTRTFHHFLAESSVQNFGLPYGGCTFRFLQFELDAPVRVTSKHSVDPRSGDRVRLALAVSEAQIVEFTQVVVHGPVADIEATPKTPLHENRLTVFQSLVGLVSVTIRQVRGRCMEPDKHATLTYGAGVLMVLLLNAGEHALKPSDLAIRIVFVGR